MEFIRPKLSVSGQKLSLSGLLLSLSGHEIEFIRPGFEYRCVDGLLTNFHLPESTLLMLVSAFAGYDTIFNAYRQAVAAQMRFFSYGDAMLITPTR